jgi:hypothetical protein
VFGFGFGPSYHSYSYVDDCLEWRRVRTSRGWRWVRVDVCEYY